MKWFTLLLRSMHVTALLCGVGILGFSGNAAAQSPSGAVVYTVVDTMVGSVGGLAVDRSGNIYVATFGDEVWRVKPDGRSSLFATGLYGASGNTIDAQGNLIQASFYGNYVSRIDRNGHATVLASEGLTGPVGVTTDTDGNIYVNNCAANSISKITADGTVSTFSESDLFSCPNGITRGPQGNFYVVNFSDERMLKVTPEGEVSEFARLPGGGNGHVTLARGSLYATSFRGHRVYSVSLGGDVAVMAGTGAFGQSDGVGEAATFAFPNGIAASPNGDRVYTNDFINRFPPTVAEPPVPLSSVRMIKLPSISTLMAQALSRDGVDGMTDVYRAFKANPATAAVQTEFEVNGYGYQLMGAGQLAAAIEVFKLNVESYPNSANVHDSLGEAYMNKGNTKKAIASYKKSVELNPANSNGIEMLKKLGAE